MTLILKFKNFKKTHLEQVKATLMSVIVKTSKLKDKIRMSKVLTGAGRGGTHL